MHKSEEVPLVNETALLADALVEMSSKGLGMTGVVDADNTLLGIYTDGDLRRTLSERISIDTPISEVMTANPITAQPNVLAAELVSLMKKQSINSLIVTDKGKVVGALNMQDLLRAGVL